MNGEQTIREDERQACWEDFVALVTCHINSGSNLKALHKKVRESGWKDLGTGDGRPMHRSKDSEVNKWLRASEGKKSL